MYILFLKKKYNKFKIIVKKLTRLDFNLFCSFIFYAIIFLKNDEEREIKSFLEKEKILNLKDKEGKTVLDYAFQNGKTDTCDFLIENGAKFKMRDDFISAAERGDIKRCKSIISKLKDKKIRSCFLNLKDKDGKTAFDYALAKERRNVCILLAKNSLEFKKRYEFTLSSSNNDIGKNQPIINETKDEKKDI